jgi:hypothetical protein
MGWDSIDCIHMSQDRAVNLRTACNVGDFVSGVEIVVFSGRTQLHWVIG